MKRMAILLLTLVLGACSARQAQRTLSGIAVTLDQVDVAVAKAMDERLEVCIQYESVQDFDHCFSGLEEAKRALVSTAAVLRSTQRALWSVEKAKRGKVFASYAPCIASSLVELAGALKAASVRIPKEVESLLSVVASYGGTCERE